MRCTLRLAMRTGNPTNPAWRCPQTQAAWNEPSRGKGEPMGSAGASAALVAALDFGSAAFEHLLVFLDGHFTPSLSRIVTLPGGLMRGRQGAGMLALEGGVELVARDADDCVRIAAGLAADRERRAELKSVFARGTRAYSTSSHPCTRWATCCNF